MATQIGGRQISLSKSPITGANTSLLHNSARGLELTGSVLLKAAPTVDLEAATKKYVDDNTGASSVSANEVVFGQSGGGFDSNEQFKVEGASDGGDAFNVVLNTGTTGSFRASGRMFQVTGSVNIAEAISLKTSAGHADSTIAIVNAGNSSDGAILIDAESGGVTIAAGNDSLFLDADGTDNDALNIDSAGGIDIDAAGVFTLDAVGLLGITGSNASGVNIAATGGALRLSGSNGLELHVGKAGELDITADGGSVDINAGDSITLDAEDDISLTTTSEDGLITLHSAHTAGVAVLIDANAAAGSILDIDAGIVDTDVQGAYSLDAGGLLGITGSNASGVNIAATGGIVRLSGSAGLSLHSSGGGEIDITADDGAIDVNAGLTFDLDATGNVSIDSTAGSVTVGAALADGQTLKLGKNGATEMIFTPAAAAGSEKISLTNTSGNAADAISIGASAGGISLSAAGTLNSISIGNQLISGSATRVVGGTSLSLEAGETALAVGTDSALTFQAIALGGDALSALTLPSYFEVSGSSSGTGAATSFSTNANAVPSSIRVYLNGVRQEINGGTTKDYSLGTNNAVVFGTAPLEGDVVIIEWRQTA